MITPRGAWLRINAHEAWANDIQDAGRPRTPLSKAPTFCIRKKNSPMNFFFFKPAYFSKSSGLWLEKKIFHRLPSCRSVGAEPLLPLEGENTRAPYLKRSFKAWR